MPKDGFFCRALPYIPFLQGFPCSGHNYPTFLVLRKASTYTPNPYALSRAGA